MKRPKKILCFIILFLPVWISCAPHIPKSDYPTEIEKVFSASFDETWDSVVKVVEILKGTMIISDRPSGLVVFRMGDKISMTVYLKYFPSTNSTIVYLTTRVKSGYYFEGIERNFYQEMEKNLWSK
jgi:hypothetical protein